MRLYAIVASSVSLQLIVSYAWFGQSWSTHRTTTVVTIAWNRNAAIHMGCMFYNNVISICAYTHTTTPQPLIYIDMYIYISIFSTPLHAHIPALWLACLHAKLFQRWSVLVLLPRLGVVHPPSEPNRVLRRDSARSSVDEKSVNQSISRLLCR